VLDYDALAKQDHENWVARGLDCALPEETTCLISLSAGGEDAFTGREFNLRENKFAAGGFVLPRSKQTTAWLNNDTMLVARDWGGGTMTKSGYPFVVKLWRRGEPLEKATEIFRGRDTDMMASPVSLIDGGGHHAGLVSRNLTFFDYETSILTPAGVKQLALPRKIEVNDLVDGQVIVTLNQDWKTAGGRRALYRARSCRLISKR
jgi:prolyl oligopeptidase